MRGYKLTNKGKSIITRCLDMDPDITEDQVGIGRLLAELCFEGEYFTYDRETNEKVEALQIMGLEKEGYIERSLIPGIESFLIRDKLRKRYPGRFPWLDDYGG